MKTTNTSISSRISNDPRHRARNSLDHVGVLLARLRLQWLLHHFSPRLVWTAYVCVNCFITIGLLALLAFATGSPFVFPSLGPTAYLFFFSPLTKASSPRNTVLGHAIGLVCGYAAFALTMSSCSAFQHARGGPWSDNSGRRSLALGYGRVHGSVSGKPSAGGGDHSHCFARHHLSAQRSRHYRGRSRAAYGAGCGDQSARRTTLPTLEGGQASWNILLANSHGAVQLPRQSAPLIVGIALAAAASFGRSPDVGAMGFRGGLLNFRVGLAADKDRRACEI